MRAQISIIALVATVSTGCSLAGLGIGAGIPRYRDAEAPLPVGTEVRVESRVRQPERLVGRVVINDRGTIGVGDPETGDTRYYSAFDDEIGVRDGSYWLVGLLTGVVLDGLAVTWAVTHIGGDVE